MALAFYARLAYQAHMSIDSIDALAQKLAEAVPPGLKSVGDDLEKNFRAVLRAGLGKLDLVSREEFAVQEAVLARTREKLELLEDRLNKLVAIADTVTKPVRKKTQAGKARKKPARKKPAR